MSVLPLVAAAQAAKTAAGSVAAAIVVVNAKAVAAVSDADESDWLLVAQYLRNFGGYLT